MKPVKLAVTAGQYEGICKGLGGNVVSIHSDAENQFVWQVAAAAGIQYSYYTGLRLVHSGNADGAPVISAAWTDGSPVDFGNPMTQARGTYPWFFDPQPDNKPPPGNMVIAWLPGAPGTITDYGTWDDFGDTPAEPYVGAGTVCKF